MSDTRTAEQRLEAAEIRTWAADNGHDIAPQGRIPAHVRAMFLAARGGGPDAGAGADDDGPAWGSGDGAADDGTMGGPDELSGLEQEFELEQQAAAAAAQQLREQDGQRMAPVASLEEARARVNAGSAAPPLPPWAGERPRPPRGDRPPAGGGAGPQQPLKVPVKVRDDIRGKVALLLALPAMTWSAADPYCGQAFAEQVEAMADTLTPLICQSAGLVKFFQDASLFMLLLAFVQACQPVGIAVWKHHVDKSVDELGRPVRRQQAGEHVQEPSNLAAYTTDMTGHVPAYQPR